jgi:1-deoxy-D-xylulose-5-phosphate synthase
MNYKENINATLINPRFLSGVDHELLQQLKNDHKLVITLEDGVLDGGFGEKIARFYGDSSMNVKCYGIEKKFLDRYNHMGLLKQCRLDVNLLKEDILKHLL